MISNIVRHLAWSVLLLAASPIGMSQDSSKLRIMTYNIHHGEGTDGKLDLPRIAKIIRQQDCDLVALQEVDRNTRRTQQIDQLEELAKLTNMRPYYGPAIDFEGGQYGNGVLSRLPVTFSKTIPLPSSEKREKRVAIELMVAPDRRPPFVFVCTHLDHTHDPADRIAQMKKIHELFGNGPSQAILAGDFNAIYEAPEFEPIRAKWVDADSKNMSPTIPVSKPDRKIDFVLLERNCPWVVENVEVLPERVASDHLPVVATLRWR